MSVEELIFEFNKLLRKADATALAHIAGASGAGKTTLLQQIKEVYPEVVIKDLDKIDDDAAKAANLSIERKDDWTDKEFKKHQIKRQELLNRFISAHAGKPVVLAGFHSEGGGQYAITVPTKNKFLLDVDAKTAAHRAYKRSLTKALKYRKTLEDISQDIKQAQADIDAFKSMGYDPKSSEWIMAWIGENI